MGTTRIAGSVVGGFLVASLAIGAPGGAFAQVPPKPPEQLAAELQNGLTQLMFEIEDLRLEVEALNILSRYCRPPDAPLKSLTEADLDYYRLRVRLFQDRLEGHQGRFARSVAAMTGASRINYVASFPEIRSTRPDATDERQNAAYWAAARRVLGEVNEVIERKQRQLNAAPEDNCRRGAPAGQPPRAAPSDDPVGGLRPPRYAPVVPPTAEPCYPTSDARRLAYNAAYDVEQAANANVNLADGWRQHIASLQVFYANQDAAPDVLARLEKLHQDAVATRKMRAAEWDAAYAALSAIANAKVPCPQAPPQPPAVAPPPTPPERPLPLPRPPPAQTSGSASQRRLRFALLGGFTLGTPVDGDVTPLPAPEVRTTPDNRRFVIVPTWFIDSGREVLDEVLGLLIESEFASVFGWERDANELKVHALGVLLGFRAIFYDPPARPLANTSDLARLGAAPWQATGRAVRPYVEGFFEPLRAFDLDSGDFRSTADRVHRAWRDGMLNNPAANPTTSLAVTSSGGYLGGVRVGGGVQIDLGGRLAGFQSSLRTGASVLVPVGSPEVSRYRLTYGFTSSGVTFQEIDDVTLSARRDPSFGFEGGLNLTRPAGGRRLTIDIGVAVQQLRGKVLLSASPSTTSTAPGAIAFSTPPGSTTIVISTVPGVPSSLGASVSDRAIWTAKGWSIGPVIRIGFVF